MRWLASAWRFGTLLAAILLFGTACLRGDDADVTPTASGPPARPIVDPGQVANHYREILNRPQFQEVAEPSVNTRIEDLLSQWFRGLGAKLGEFRFASRMPRSRNGWNIGGLVASAGSPLPAASRANSASTSATKSGARSDRSS